MIEGKRDGQQMSGGQWKANCARVRDGRTVLLVYGTPPHDVRRMFCFRGGVDPVREGTCVAAQLEDVLLFCQIWAQWADRQPAPVRRESPFPAGQAMETVAKLQESRKAVLF